MKTDIFNGKIKKEYFSYILGYMIFFVLLLIGVGILCIYASIWGMTINPFGERLLIASFGGLAFVFAGVYVFLSLLVIRNFPKYQKVRRILFNSDCYFTGTTSNVYFGTGRTRRGRRSKLAFEVVTAFAEAEKRMGNKKPIRYTVYSALAFLMGVLGLVDLIAMPLLFENATIFSTMSQNIFLFCYLLIAVVCIALAIVFLSCAYKIAQMAPLENSKWKYALYTALVDIAVRQNNKKLKFWYDKDQLTQIEDLAKSASETAELRVETKGNKPVSFQVVDLLDGCVIFTGIFL